MSQLPVKPQVPVQPELSDLTRFATRLDDADYKVQLWRYHTETLHPAATHEAEQGEIGQAFAEALRVALLLTTWNTHEAHYEDYAEQLWSIQGLMSKVDAVDLQTQARNLIETQLLPNVPVSSSIDYWQEKGMLENIPAWLDQLDNTYERALARIYYASHLEGEAQTTQLEMALADGRQIESDFHQRTVVLTQVASKMSDKEALLSEALADARQVQDPYWRTMSLLNVARQSPDDKKARLVNEALGTAWTIQTPRPKVQALGILLPLLEEKRHAELEPQIMPMVEALGMEYSQAGTLAFFFSYLSEESQARALQMVLKFENPLYRVRALQNFAPNADAELLTIIHTSLLEQLLQLKDATRDQFLSLVGYQRIFAVNVLGQNTLKQLLADILEVCGKH